jgi:hypothetical protein
LVEAEAAELGRGSGPHDASDQHPGAEVGTEHRSHLGAEQRPGAEDRRTLGYQMLGVLGGLGVLNDPVLRTVFGRGRPG